MHPGRPSIEIERADRMKHLRDAAAAVASEYRRAARVVDLVATNVEEVIGGTAMHDRLFVVSVTILDFEWTWEGAAAFGTQSDDVEATAEFDADLATAVGDIAAAERPKTYDWFAEIVDADVARGKLYVITDREAAVPKPGRFHVRPFEFLEALYEAYHVTAAQSLFPRLARSLAIVGGMAPSEAVHRPGFSPSIFGDAWRHELVRLWGPPGTGKTWSIGQTVAECLLSTDERILVVSTTNHATDGVAIEIGRAVRRLAPEFYLKDVVLRIGRSADVERYRAAGMTDLLFDPDAPERSELSSALKKIGLIVDAKTRAAAKMKIFDLRRSISDAGQKFNSDVRVIVTTVYGALMRLSTPKMLERLNEGRSPFDTVIIDEAGLVSRALAAALELYAQKRLVLAGDPKQLSPIARMTRILPTNSARWVAESGLAHLDVESPTPEVRLLKRQYRMAPEIRTAVSNFQYAGILDDAPEVFARSKFFERDDIAANLPRAVWYVLDEDELERDEMAAERPEGSRGWERKGTLRILDKLFRAHPVMARSRGLFVSPFVAQANEIAAFLSSRDDTQMWRASTLHQQQGAEADYVIFDTVHASSTAWSFDEWQRLVNVGISRAREFVFCLARRAEMRQSYLRSLAADLFPRVLEHRGSAWHWKEVPGLDDREIFEVDESIDPAALGSQIVRRRMLRPVLSAEQESLCALAMDGRPRLVRGVAGSGKTFVLAYWAAKLLAEDKRRSALIVYANAALRGLLGKMIGDAWQEFSDKGPVPWERIRLSHVSKLFGTVLEENGLPSDPTVYGFDWNAMAEAILAIPELSIEPVADALFLDEAQDFGQKALRLLLEFTEPTGADDGVERTAMIFYDNAQNIYERPIPRWSELGLDMRGRSRVMKESHRSTRPIAECALNVLARLVDLEKDDDHLELLTKKLIVLETRDSRPWYAVRFNQADGPHPDFRRFPSRDAELAEVATRLQRWIVDERVRPRDLAIIVNSREFGQRAAAHFDAALAPSGVGATFISGAELDRDDKKILVTTPHSFKGYDAEIVICLAADLFASRGNPLASNLYVAMTRARSLLVVTMLAAPDDIAGKKIVDVIRRTGDDALRAAAP